MNGKTKVFICYHQKCGFLTFGSYSNATRSDTPNFRSTFSTMKKAEYRTKGNFYTDIGSFPGSEIEIKEIDINWNII